MPRALLSVSDKTGLVDLARGLAARGYELVSTGGTARALTDAGLAVTGVADVTGFPEMMDGRVKTLHPKIHGGILARRDHPEDLASAGQHGIGLVDLVVVNLYPFAETAKKADVAFDDLVEQIDIGGPSMVRAAAKNFRDVLVVVEPADYAPLLDAIDRTPTVAFRFELMRKALAHTAAYDTAIATTLGTITVNGDEFHRTVAETGTAKAVPYDAVPHDAVPYDAVPHDAVPHDAVPHDAVPYDAVPHDAVPHDAVPYDAAPDAVADRIEMSLEKIRDLRYGENPHQKAAWYTAVGHRFSGATAAGLGSATILQGKELSYTNLLDLDAAARIALEFDEPAAVVIKHTNPCGAATGDSPADAYVRAREADSLAAYGGIVALNRSIDVAAAEAIVSTFIEAVIAPSVDEAAKPVLARKAKMRVVTADFTSFKGGGVEFRSILGAMLMQERDAVVEAHQPWLAASLPDGLRVVTRRQPTADEWEALRFAWRICAHVKSNTVIFTDARRTLAVGAGQMSRVDSVNVAIMKAQAANRSLTGSVAASDAYFPFRDGLDGVAAAGATAVVQPGGSIRDAEVIAAADEHGLAMVFAGKRHFRH